MPRGPDCIAVDNDDPASTLTQQCCGELGDCGAASAPMQLAFAVLRFERGDTLRRVLIYGESDDGALGVCLVEKAAQEATSK